MFKHLKRCAFYGGITSFFTMSLAYSVGYHKGVLDTSLQQQNSGLEHVTHQQYKIQHPLEQEEYLIDFDRGNVTPLSGNRSREQLEDIFGRR